jgi:predicted RNA-binding Zn ribbon-like protein
MSTRTPQTPTKLELLRDFVNSIDLEHGPDAIREPAGLVEWLAEYDLVEAGTRATRAQVGEAQAVREALRTLLLANNDEAVETHEAAATLDRAARRSRLVVRFHPDGSSGLEPGATGVAGAIGRIVAIAAASTGSDEWSRLKACRWHSCKWAFYDHARNHSRAWCSMRVCGNREKARIYRERHAH